MRLGKQPSILNVEAAPRGLYAVRPIGADVFHANQYQTLVVQTWQLLHPWLARAAEILRDAPPTTPEAIAHALGDQQDHLTRSSTTRPCTPPATSATGRSRPRLRSAATLIARGKSAQEGRARHGRAERSVCLSYCEILTSLAIEPARRAAIPASPPTCSFGRPSQLRRQPDAQTSFIIAAPADAACAPSGREVLNCSIALARACGLVMPTSFMKESCAHLGEPACLRSTHQNWTSVLRRATLQPREYSPELLHLLVGGREPAPPLHARVRSALPSGLAAVPPSTSPASTFARSCCTSGRRRSTSGAC